jgi:hypothetical protein
MRWDNSSKSLPTPLSAISEPFVQTHDRVGAIGSLIVSRAEKIVVMLDVACLVLSITKWTGYKGPSTNTIIWAHHKYE